METFLGTTHADQSILTKIVLQQLKNEQRMVDKYFTISLSSVKENQNMAPLS